MARPYKIDRTLRERRRIIRLLDYLKRDDLTTDQMERIGKRLQKSGRSALRPLVRKLWKENNGTAIYRYTCMLDFFDDSNWLEQLVQITLKRTDLEDDARLALLDALQDYGVDVTVPPFAKMTGYGASSIEGFILECLEDGERGMVRFMDMFIDADDMVRERMVNRLCEYRSEPAIDLLEVLLTFESRQVFREVVKALGRIKNLRAVKALEKALKSCVTEDMETIRRSLRRLAFMGVKEEPGAAGFTAPTDFYHIQVGPLDLYGSRTQLFSWKLEDATFGALVMLLNEGDGVVNALSYRMQSEADYNAVLREVVAGELLEQVSLDYAMCVLGDAIYHSREKGLYLPPDLYVDLRIFDPELLRIKDYIPSFSKEQLDSIVEQIPLYIPESSELLDNPCLEGWQLSETLIYDIAEKLGNLRYDDLHLDNKNELLEIEIDRICSELIIPRRGDLIRRLLLTADYMQQTGHENSTVQRTIATALSLAGEFILPKSHPFIRRLIIDSIFVAQQALAEGYDLRLEEGRYDDEE